MLKQTATAGGGNSNGGRNSSGDGGEKTDGTFTNASETPTVLALIPCRNKICTRSSTTTMTDGNGDNNVGRSTATSGGNEKLKIGTI
ncbi:hypothetical protein EJ110_NYTH18640 [Nymphaea thermarum]|nr:hypothetical protein EJ110_NYTH18640 [Nymphaea thermarum]